MWATDRVDQDIVEIVRFGSSVYAPGHARDLDLLVFTRKRKDYSAYMDAARIAIMAYLATEETRWGRLKRMLPAPHGDSFQRITEKLHIEFTYLGNYPKHAVKEEFERWLRVVEEFTYKLETEVSHNGLEYQANRSVSYRSHFLKYRNVKWGVAT